jgi:hypothetical protein
VMETGEMPAPRVLFRDEFVPNQSVTPQCSIRDG